MRPPDLPDRWLHARRQEALVRWAKRSAVLVVLVVTVLLAANWWIVTAYVTGRERAVADACAGTSFADGAILAAGGHEAVTTPEHPALDGYRDPAVRTEAARRIRDRASLLDDR